VREQSIQKDATVTSSASATPEDDHDPVLDLPRGPSIAVLPFANLSSDPEQELFVDAVVEEITTQLARFKELFVIARTTAFQYKGQALDVRRIGRELGVRYILEGSIRTSGSLLRVTAQLIETLTGTHLWAETYDRDLSVQNVFEIQDDIAQRVAASIAQPFGVLGQVHLTTSHQQPTESWDAYQCYLHLWAYVHGIGPDTHLTARKKLEEALAADPACAAALAALGYLALEEYRFDWNKVPEQGDPLDRAEALARRAYDIDSTCMLALLTLSMTCYHREQPERAREFGERALQLNPNDAEFLCEYGLILSHLGDRDRGIALLEKAMALHPRFNTLYYVVFALNALLEGDDAQALAYAKRIDKPNMYWDPLFRAAFLGLLDRNAEAEDALSELKAIFPNIDQALEREFAKWPIDERIVGRLTEGLAKAGLAIADT
jgi:TolB-like protein/Tfp pilus assembly protein PilF